MYSIASFTTSLMSSSIFEICERVDMPRVFSLRSSPSSMPSICCRSSVWPLASPMTSKSMVMA